MAGTILILRGSPLTVNYQPYIFFGAEVISYCTLPIADSIEPGTYDIPVGQQTNLDWFYDNFFRFNKYGRLHVGQLMELNEPDQVVIY